MGLGEDGVDPVRKGEDGGGFVLIELPLQWSLVFSRNLSSESTEWNSGGAEIESAVAESPESPT